MILLFQNSVDLIVSNNSLDCEVQILRNKDFQIASEWVNIRTCPSFTYVMYVDQGIPWSLHGHKIWTVMIGLFDVMFSWEKCIGFCWKQMTSKAMDVKLCDVSRVWGEQFVLEGYIVVVALFLAQQIYAVIVWICSWQKSTSPFPPLLHKLYFCLHSHLGLLMLLVTHRECLPNSCLFLVEHYTPCKYFLKSTFLPT